MARLYWLVSLYEQEDVYRAGCSNGEALIYFDVDFRAHEYLNRNIKHNEWTFFLIICAYRRLSFYTTFQVSLFGSSGDTHSFAVSFMVYIAVLIINFASRRGNV